MTAIKNIVHYSFDNSNDVDNWCIQKHYWYIFHINIIECSSSVFNTLKYNKGYFL